MFCRPFKQAIAYCTEEHRPERQTWPKIHSTTSHDAQKQFDHFYFGLREISGITKYILNMQFQMFEKIKIRLKIIRLQSKTGISITFHISLSSDTNVVPRIIFDF